MVAIIESAVGRLKLVEENEQLVAVSFTKEPKLALPNNPLLSLTKKQLDGYFARTLQEFDLPLAPAGTDFQQKVWQQLLLIPYGKTISYLELAHRLGDPKIIRAAASANGKNPMAIIIPCHRVIGAHGEMTGYAGGIQRKKDLLSLEGAAVMKQLNLF